MTDCTLEQTMDFFSLSQMTPNPFFGVNTKNRRRIIDGNKEGS